MDDSTGNSAILGAFVEKTARVQTGRSKEGGRYSVGEEVANAITHGLGAALSIAALAILATLAGKRGDIWHVVSLCIYGATMVFLYSASSLYHSVPAPRAKNIFRILDHSSIFLLIAGTYTPVTLVLMRGPWGWALFSVVWAMAIGGIVVKAFLWNKAKMFGYLGVSLYIAMGWLVIIAVKPMLEMLPLGMIAWLLAGGLFYTLGVPFYMWKRLPYHHAVWHLFVLGGSACHFLAILWYVLPRQ
jgi:hemolysin III